MRKKILSAIIVFIVLNLVTVFAAPDISFVSQTVPDGIQSCETVAVSENIAFIGDGAIVHVYDISNPDEPLQLSRVNCGAKIMQMTVRGKYLIVGASQVMRIYDISNPTNIQNVGGYRHGNTYLTSMAVDDGYVYLGAHSSGLKIIKADDETLANHDVNQQLAAVYAPQPAAVGVITGLCVQGDYLYVASFVSSAQIPGAILVYDISNRAEPVLKGYCQIKHKGDTSKYVRMNQIAVSGNYVYAITNDIQGATSAASNGVYTVDASPAYEAVGEPVVLDTPAFTKLSSATTGRITSFFINGNYMFVCEQDDKEISVYDITEQQNPQFIGRCPFKSGNISGPCKLTLSGNLIVIGDNESGFSIYKIQHGASGNIEISCGDMLSEGTVTMSAEVTNFTSEDMYPAAIMALYTKGKLEKLTVNTETEIKKGESAETEADIDIEGTEERQLRAFV